MTKSLIGAFALLVFGVSAPVEYPGAKQGPAIAVGVNRSIAVQDSGLHYVEPAFVVSLTDPNYWLIGAMVVEDPAKRVGHCATWFSADAGVIWVRTDFPNLLADPNVVFTGKGNAYFSCLDNSSRSNGYYYTSGNFGADWSVAHRVGPGHDHPFLSTSGQDVYWVSTSTGNSRLDIRRALDGETFSESTTVAFTTDSYRYPEKQYYHDNLMHTMLSNGDLALPYVAYYIVEQTPTVEGVYLITSADRGKSFSRPVLITKNAGSSKGMGRLLVDNSTSRFANRLYFVYPMGHGPSEFNGIGMSVSADRGATWRDVLVQAPVPEGNRFYNPTAAVNKDGTVGVYWYDRRNDPQRQKNDIYFTASVDGGQSFAPAKRVTDVGSEPCCRDTDRSVMTVFPGGGHYSGIAALADGSFQLVWSDSRSGRFQLYTSNVTVK